MELKQKLQVMGENNALIKKAYLIAHDVKVKKRMNLSDRDFAMSYYKEKTGKVLNLDNPQTFDEKLWWLKLNYREPLQTVCSDKYKIREYVKGCGCEELLNELYGVYDRAEDVEFEKIPSPCFLKTNHGSGNNIIYDRDQPFNKKAFVKKFNKSLDSNYYYQSREWNYKNIEPKIIAEKVLRDKDGKLPNDYKFFCFYGKPKVMLFDTDVCLDTGSHNLGGLRNIYDENKQLLKGVKITRNNHDKQLDISDDIFIKMKSYASILSEPFPHVRVDFYCVDGKIYIGEMTFYHMGACNKIEPCEFDLQLGEWVDISRIVKQSI